MVAKKEHGLYSAPFIGGAYEIYDPLFVRHLGEQVQDWKYELGFTPCTVRLQAFMDEERYVGVGFSAPDGECTDAEDFAYFGENPQIVFL